MKELAEILQDIQDYFGDTSRSPSETKDGLERISDEALGYAESISDEE